MVDLRPNSRSFWLFRGLRMSLVVGVICAAMHAWTVWARYDDDRLSWIKSQLTYECVARLSDEQMNARRNEFGNINVKTSATPTSHSSTWHPMSWRWSAMAR